MMQLRCNFVTSLMQAHVIVYVGKVGKLCENDLYVHILLQTW